MCMHEYGALQMYNKIEDVDKNGLNKPIIVNYKLLLIYYVRSDLRTLQPQFHFVIFVLVLKIFVEIFTGTEKGYINFSFAFSAIALKQTQSSRGESVMCKMFQFLK